ncbi:Alpha/Beta hydrolase protein [Pilaira anomala]|nr:Alpha/Beta hydrolase protein [Pilaira anomala]
MYPHSLQHVKGSRSLDASSIHSSASESSTGGNNNAKVTNIKQPHYAKELNTQTNTHKHHHRSHSQTNSLNGSTTTVMKKACQVPPLSPPMHISVEKDYSTKHAQTSLSGNPIFLETKKPGNKFLRTFQHHQMGVPEPGRSHSWPYLGYMLNSFKNFILTFYFNWTMIFTAPISSAAFILVYPITITFLVVFEIGLKLFLEKMGGTEVIRYISLKYGHGFGAINWGTPELLLCESSALLVHSTISTLGLPATPITVSNCRRRTFDLSIAQTFVLLSSLIYERDSAKVNEAYKLYSEARKDPQVTPADLTKVEAKMKELFWESEVRIRQISESWGLHFAGVSELKSLGGPFCGIFWSETAPFIVVAFKGTTPTNYEEFLVDATFQRTDARSFLFGCVHEGFYESLFSTQGFGDQDIRDPYGAILAAVQAKATQLQEQLNTMEPIQLWITGHSLGAALSSLLFSRWLKCPSDLSRRLVLRDCYIIGTPAVGDSDFASTFASHSNLPVTRSSTLWRIVNNSDIFTRLPPGYDSKSVGHFVSESDFFNYSHVGHAIKITRKWNAKPLKTFPSSYQPPMQVNIVTQTNASSILLTTSRPKAVPQPLPILPNWAKFFLSKPWLQGYLPNGNPIYFIEKLYPYFLMDHIPSRYFEGLQRARVYYENIEQEGMTESLGIVSKE